MTYRRNADVGPGRAILPKMLLALLCGAASLAPIPALAAGGGLLAAADRAICGRVAAAAQGDDRPSRGDASVRLAQVERTSRNEPKKPDSEEDLADELSEMLQACSYDGQALSVRAAELSGKAKSAGEDAVRDIMRFTGLPQNFRVVEGDVPNAAAMIVIGSDRLSQRVIAYNAKFIEDVRSATNRHDWAPVSIMAHEIGHHLSGHTLMPGGSQPPIELEADKFSGFVLYKMGATLMQAQDAISTLVPVADGPTHPGRRKRLAAVEAGWMESCNQQGEECSAADLPAVAAAEPPEARLTPQPPADRTLTDTAALELRIPGPADIRMPGKHPASKGDAVILPETLDRVPRLDAAATPAKLDRFVYDEVGVFHPAIKAELSRRAFAFAARHNIEIVTVIAKDLQGRDPDRYALDVMRQLRVGKLEVGNGAVLVVAPVAKQVGVALGPGLAAQYEDGSGLRRYLESYLKTVDGGARPQIASDLIEAASSRIMRETQGLEWVVRYATLDRMLAAAADYRQRQRDNGEKYDPAKDPTWRKLARIEATVVSLSPDKTDDELDINGAKERNIGPAMHVRTDGGQDAVLYVDPNVAVLMPTKLEAGRTYAFVARDSFAAADTPQFELVSYDPVR